MKEKEIEELQGFLKEYKIELYEIMSFLRLLDKNVTDKEKQRKVLIYWLNYRKSSIISKTFNPMFWQTLPARF